MIRVHRVAPAQFTAHVESPPLLEARTREGLESLLLEARRHDLTAPEVAAVRRALDSLGGAEEASIVVAVGGAVFRVERFAPPPAPAPGPRVTVEITTRHADAKVLVASDDRAWNERMSEALRFMGYDALVLGEGSRAAEPTVESDVRRCHPLVVLIGAATWARSASALRTGAGSATACIVLFPKAERPAASPEGTAGVLELPVRIATARDVIDAALDALPRS